MAKQVAGFPKLPGLDDGLKDHKWLDALRKFSEDNKDLFSFGADDAAQRLEFTNQLLGIIDFFMKNDCSVHVMEHCLSSLIVMSRDRFAMSGQFSSEETWKNLLILADLGTADSNPLCSSISMKICACKCLSNIVFLTNDANGFCNDDRFVKSVINRLQNFHATFSVKNETDLEFLTLRLLYLITVFSSEAREMTKEDHGGLRILINHLSNKLEHCKIAEQKKPCLRGVLPSVDARSCSEILKTIFNLNVETRKEDRSQVQEEKIVKEFEDLTEACRKCLLTQVEDDPTSTAKLHTDAQNVLYSIPGSCLYETYLIPTRLEETTNGVFSYDEPDIPLSFDKKDVSAIVVILKSVEDKVKSGKLTTENLQPVLSLLSHLSRNSRSIRKYCKNYVIPPRKDFKNLPEVGPEFRNKLIKLFTDTNTAVKSSAADFIFVLCKEKVGRLVKYTGYGNAAGLLASRGLLAGGRGDTLYSDTDSDSDTEEYKENIDKINPVTGHIPPDAPDPMEGMSEEQKEYLAVQLANQLSKLSDDDTIKPMCVDPATGKLISFQQRVHELPEERDSDDESD